MIHVSAQEIHLLTGFLDLGVQLVHLPLKAWGGTAWGGEAVKRADVWGFLQRIFPGDPKNPASPDQWAGIGAEMCPHELGGGEN